MTDARLAGAACDAAVVDSDAEGDDCAHAIAGSVEIARAATHRTPVQVTCHLA
jgi:hypothetical protein